MNQKRFTLFSLLLVVMALMAGAIVHAQDETTATDMPYGFGRGFGPGFDGNSTIILEATGLTQEALFEALQDGSTLADLITANDGDVDEVIAQLVAEATTRINEQADTMIAGLDEHYTDMLNGTFERREGFGGFGERPDGFNSRRGRPGRGYGLGSDLTPDTDTDSTSDDS